MLEQSQQAVTESLNLKNDLVLLNHRIGEVSPQQERGDCADLQGTRKTLILLTFR